MRVGQRPGIDDPFYLVILGSRKLTAEFVTTSEPVTMKKKEHIELRVAQIISTDKRQEIMNVIIRHKNEFTVADVLGN